jgi:hypothetical protein
VGKVGNALARGIWFYLRLCIASALAGAVIHFFGYYFTEVGKTQDFVLEYRYWITAGIYLLAAAMWIGFMLFTKTPKAAFDSQDKSHDD